MADITEVIQRLEPGSVIELFELDISPITGTNTTADHFYFHAGTNKYLLPVTWKGVQYQPFPMEAEGFEQSTRGTLPRPRLRVANVSGIITALLLTNQDLVGAKVIRRRTLGMYLDAVNFPGGNAEADPTQEFPDDLFYVEQKISETKKTVEIELSSALDLHGLQLPTRVISTNVCPWRYRKSECGYTGTVYFDVTGASVPTLAQDVCGKSIKDCKLRFGARGNLPFGGFPAARAYKF